MGNEEKLWKHCEKVAGNCDELAASIMLVVQVPQSAIAWINLLRERWAAGSGAGCAGGGVLLDACPDEEN